ncbi:hypothetical protein QE372_005234 [Agrobacterium pusense]|nr:hypothetical protein [Agrobacterium pusense]
MDFAAALVEIQISADAVARVGASEKFRKLDSVSTSEFHTYTVGDLVLPKRAAAE